MSCYARNAALKKYRIINERKAAKKLRESNNAKNEKLPSSEKIMPEGVIDSCDYSDKK